MIEGEEMAIRSEDGPARLGVARQRRDMVGSVTVTVAVLALSKLEQRTLANDACAVSGKLFSMPVSRLSRLLWDLMPRLRLPCLLE